MNIFNHFEVGLLHGLQDAVGGPFLDTVMPLITVLGDAGIFWIVLAVVLLFFRKTRRAGVTMGIALLAMLLFGNTILKPLIQRIRPYDFDTSIVLIIPPESQYSFPSGHTYSSFAAAVSLFLYHKRAGVAAIVLAALIAFSRLYLMVHYPLDIVGGIVLGILTAYLASYLAKLLIEKTRMPV